MSANKVKRVYTRLYADSGQLRAYVEWSCGARTEGEAVETYHGEFEPVSAHLQAIFARAEREWLKAQHEVWGRV